MDTYQDQVGQWVTLHVRAPDRPSARARAIAQARRAGYRGADVTCTTRTGAAAHTWRVELRVEPRGGAA